MLFMDAFLDEMSKIAILQGEMARVGMKSLSPNPVERTVQKKSLAKSYLANKQQTQATARASITPKGPGYMSFFGPGMRERLASRPAAPAPAPA